MDKRTPPSVPFRPAAVTRPGREQRKANVRNPVAPIHWKYDVFLNFRGEDARQSFADYLHTSLKYRKVRVFKDDSNLLGKDIGKGVFQAINDSQIAILVISKNYGGSKWCLDELCQILHCRTEPGRVVLPLFYDVDVSEVCHQTGKFGEVFHALAKHHPSEVVKEWKQALSSLAGIGKWSLQEVTDGHQGELVEMVADKVLKILSKEISVFPISCPTTETLASHLRNSLKGENISVFSNNDCDLIGKDLVHETRNAMEQCKIFIPIISRDFASYPHCLDSLAQMFECVDTNGSKILPIFYKMDPSQNHLQENMRQLNGQQYTPQQWKKSLERVCSLGALVLENTRDEGKLVMKAIRQVRAVLKDCNA